MQSMIWAEKIICNRGKSECSHKFGGKNNLQQKKDANAVINLAEKIICNRGKM